MTLKSEVPADRPAGQQPSALPLVVGVSTSALFDLTEEDAVFRREGVEAYEKLQLDREKVPLRPGTAFEVIQRLLALNVPDAPALVQVVVLSKNSPDLSLRAFHSFEHHGLKITQGSFTSGRSVAPFVPAWGTNLFLSNDTVDVRAVADAGTAAARLGVPPPPGEDAPDDEVRLAFDGDSVVFSPESDMYYQEHGLTEFHAHERAHAQVPMKYGLFGHQFLPKLAALRRQSRRPDGTSRVRIAIVTARDAPAHERVIHTLRQWGTPADEAHFVGKHEKMPILRAMRVHIFFDDQERHFLGASGVVSSGLVPGLHRPELPIIPA